MARCSFLFSLPSPFYVLPPVVPRNFGASFLSTSPFARFLAPLKENYERDGGFKSRVHRTNGNSQLKIYGGSSHYLARHHNVLVIVCSQFSGCLLSRKISLPIRTGGARDRSLYTFIHVDH